MEFAIGLFLGLLGAIPILIDYELYLNRIKIGLAKDDLIFESLHITFDIVSLEEMHIHSTCKIKIKRDNAKLILGHTTDFGKNSDRITKIDNVPIQNEFVTKDDVHELMTYTAFDKSVGEKLIFEDSFKNILQRKQRKSNDDGCGTLLEFHKCRKLTLQVIFPENVAPSDLIYTESFVKSGEEKVKIKSNDNKHLVNFNLIRKQVLWTVDYPSFKKKYNVNWTWRV